MNRIIFMILLFQLIGCRDNESNPDPVTGLGKQQTLKTSNLDTIGLDSGDIIWSDKPSTDWADGYPLGNGRLGAMVLGRIHEERISLNHDLLWRQFWQYQNRNTAEDFEEIRNLGASGEWDKMEEIVERKIASSGQPIYVNPYVPAGDLYINFKHVDQPVTDYKRVLHMNKGVVSINYKVSDVKFKREMFSSWKQGILVTHLTASKAGMLTGEVSLSRILDPECIVSGYALHDRVVLEGQFEEGKRFAIVLKVIQRGGRMTIGRRKLKQDSENLPQKNFGLKYVFSNDEMFGTGDGASTFFDSSDEVTILLAITTDDQLEQSVDLVAKTNDKLDGVSSVYSDLEREHISDFQSIYNRVTLDFGNKKSFATTSSLLKESVEGETASPQILEKMFNMSRYLAIASGRPQAPDKVNKAPINLQGIWNQDRRPAWDSDYHLDLNLQMSYWPLDMLNLGDHVGPLMDWVEKMIPQGRIAAKDLFGCEGIYFPPTCDYNNLGNVDNIGFYWSGGAPWIAQILWQHWEYSNDQSFLKNRLYPFMLELAQFYNDFLIRKENGDLVPSLSTSPEMSIAGRKRTSFASSASTMDLELIRDLFENLIEASKYLGVNQNKILDYELILSHLPNPVIDQDGSLAEWLEIHEPGDPGHRHKSHLVGLCPGDRITVENTPNYADAAYKALQKRHAAKENISISFGYVWDAQILARLYRGNEAFEQIKNMLPIHVLDNLLLTINDWSGKGGNAWFKDIKVFQIESSIALGATIMEMLIQDRQGVIKLLPALPNNLMEGKVTGVRARGGFEIDMEWSNGMMESVRLLSIDGKTCQIKDNEYNNLRIISEGNETSYKKDNTTGTISFNTKKGSYYQLTFY